MDSTASHFVVPTIIDVPELIVTRDDADFDGDESTSLGAAWLGKLQFVASALSYTLGLGNFWRFPHLCFKYSGGAFLVAYTITLVLVGFPLFMMESAFGQYANEGPITIWRISPAFEGIGYSMCLISTLVAIYFNIINSFTVYYLFASLTSLGELPFTSCNNKWNTINCLFNSSDTSNITAALLPPNCVPSNSSIVIKEQDSMHLIARLNSSQLQDASSIFLIPDAPLSTSTSTSTSSASPNQLLLSTTVSSLSRFATKALLNCTANITTNPFEFEKIIQTPDKSVVLPSTEYFHNNLLALSGSINDITNFNFDQWLCLLLAWTTVFVAVSKSWRLSGRLAVIAVLVPYLALVAMFVRAITLDGSINGVKLYLLPDWTKLQNIEIWADAMTQLFFSLSPCLGAVISLSSMNKFHNNFHADASLIVLLNYATSLLCGIIVFALLGYMSQYSGIELIDVADKGLGLIFIVYSEGLSQMPLANLSSTLFFATLLFLGVSSQTTVIEFVTSTLIDTWPHKLRYRKPLILMITCAALCLLGSFMCLNNGFHTLQLLDSYAGTYTSLFVAIFESLAIAWVYGIDNFLQDIDDMISVHRSLFPSRAYWCFMWRYLTPSVVFAILLFSFTDAPLIEYRDKQYPNWTGGFGTFLTLFCVAFIPTIAFVRFALTPNGSLVDRLTYLCRPSEDWAPSSYVSGPKLLNKHMMLDDDIDGRPIFSSQPTNSNSFRDNDQDSNDSNEDVRFIDGKASYIIPEDEDDTDTGLTTNETNV